MIKSFGVKQAVEAGKFATTKEARLTVLATMAMLGVKNKIAKQVVKARLKLSKKKVSINKTEVKLAKKRTKLDWDSIDNTLAVADIDNTSSDWLI